jgi:hypothetical protein
MITIIVDGLPVYVVDDLSAWILLRHLKDAGSDDEPRDERGRWTAEQHANELKEAIHDNPRFDAAVARLKADRGVTPEHTKQIANSFLGYTPSVRSKSGLIGEIAQRQRIEQRQLARAREIDKLKSW